MTFKLDLIQRLGRRPAAASRTERLLHSFLPRLDHALGAGAFAGMFVEFLAFGIKQAYACIFGGLLLVLILATHFLYPDGVALARYDFLFLAAVGIQIWMLVANSRHWKKPRSS